MVAPTEKTLKQLLRKGSKVEVTSNEDGFQGSWYTATIVEEEEEFEEEEESEGEEEFEYAISINKKNSKKRKRRNDNGFWVEYKTLFVTEDNESEHLRGFVEEEFIRPLPPPLYNDHFELYDVVDAFLNDGWWTGTIVDHDGVDRDGGCRFMVMFMDPLRLTMSFSSFSSSDLRLHFHWNGVKWIHPLKKKKNICEENAGKVCQQENLEIDPNAQVNSLEVSKNDNDERLPFKKSSPVWEIIDSLDVFKEIPPQKPHFSPLQKCNEHKREILAINMLVTFAYVVESTSHCPVNATIVRKNLEILKDLELHGFDVTEIRNHINMQLAQNNNYVYTQGEQEELQNHFKKLCITEKNTTAEVVLEEQICIPSEVMEIDALQSDQNVINRKSGEVCSTSANLSTDYRGTKICYNEKITYTLKQINDDSGFIVNASTQEIGQAMEVEQNTYYIYPDSDKTLCNQFTSLEVMVEGRKRGVKKRSLKVYQRRKNRRLIYIKNMVSFFDKLKIESSLTKMKKQLVVQEINDSLNNEDVILEEDMTKAHVRGKIVSDGKMMKEWIENLCNEGGEEPEADNDGYNESSWWESQRELFHGLVMSFISRMNPIQGGRKFPEWKGSVVDSVVGAFLTQNVSDTLSSSAFISLAAQYPCKFRGDLVSMENVGPKELLSPVMMIDKVEGDIVSMENAGPKELLSSEMMIDKIGGDILSMENVGPKELLSSEMMIDKVGGDIVSMENMGPKKQLIPELMIDNDKHVRVKKKKRRIKRKKVEIKKIKIKSSKWSNLKKLYLSNKQLMEISVKTSSSSDSLDWYAVKSAHVDEVSRVIEDRGMNNKLALRIKNFLNRIALEHGHIDLEWLRHIPHEKANEYLLSIEGLGVKSVECVRLLTLQQQAFPVDRNVARIAVRLGWVPLDLLPEGSNMHLLKGYPPVNNIQRYLWQRLCTLDHKTLCELHYMMITFGKVFCTKTNPNCNACPMRPECKHYASVSSSSSAQTKIFKSGDASDKVEMSSALICTQPYEKDIEDLFYIELNIENVEKNSHQAASKEVILHVSKSKSMRQMKAEHHVYELPDSHPLLNELETRLPDDPCPYLLATWTQDSCEPLEHESNLICSAEDEYKEEHDILYGSLLVPCWTAMEGRFPLDGTYFQVNEVFADHESSLNPFVIPRSWVQDLETRTLHCATSVRSIYKDLTTEKVQHIFWKDFVCVKGFDRKQRAPKPLPVRFRPQGRQVKRAKGPETEATCTQTIASISSNKGEKRKRD